MCPEGTKVAASVGGGPKEKKKLSPRPRIFSLVYMFPRNSDRCEVAVKVIKSGTKGHNDYTMSSFFSDFLIGTVDSAVEKGQDKIVHFSVLPDTGFSSLN